MSPGCPTCGAPVPRASGTLISCPKCQATYVPAGARQISLLTRVGSNPLESVASINLTPDFLSRWRLGQLLGAGAMGTVYRAEELGTGRQVAIKFLTRIDDPAHLARFLNEGRLLASVRHPCVIALHDVQALDGFPYLVTEYVEGGTVRSLLAAQRTLSQSLALHIMIQVLDGLHAFHSRGIVHRDLKPENVLVTGRGDVRLADLGIAKKYGDQRGLKHTPDSGSAPTHAEATVAGALIGTPRYMAPEQVRGEPAVIASDLHAAGAMLYEMLSGQPPFDAQTLPDLLYQIETTPAPDLARRAHVHATIAALVMRALAKRLAERPGSAADMATALRKIQDTQPRDNLRFGDQLDRVIKLKDKVRPSAPPGPPPPSPAMPPVNVQNRDRIATARPRTAPAPSPRPAPSEEAALRFNIARSPKSALDHFALARYLDQQNRLAEAETSYRTSIQFDPRNAQAQAHLGLLLARQGHSAKAEQRLRAALAIEPESPFLHQALGDFMSAWHRREAAVEAYRAGLAHDPESSALNYRLIITLRDTDPAGALAALKSLVASDPRNGWARRQLDELTGVRTRLPLADYQAIASAYRTSGAAHFDLARALERAGRVKEARAAYATASEDPSYGWATYDVERIDNL